MLKTIEIECYGTKTTKEAAEKAGKNPNAVFESQVPDLEACEDVEAIVKAFQTCYGFETTEKFWNKCIKHLCDKYRADFHRVSKAGVTDKKRLEFLQYLIMNGRMADAVDWQQREKNAKGSGDEDVKSWMGIEDDEE